jgi:hypothetical protein
VVKTLAQRLHRLEWTANACAISSRVNKPCRDAETTISSLWWVLFKAASVYKHPNRNVAGGLSGERNGIRRRTTKSPQLRRRAKAISKENQIEMKETTKLTGLFSVLQMGARLGYVEQPPPPFYANPNASQDMATVAGRGDIAGLPAPLQNQIARIAGRPHSQLPTQAFVEADSASQLFQYYSLDTAIKEGLA